MDARLQKLAQLVDSGGFARAEPLLRSYVARRPGDFVAAYLLGHTLLKLHRPDDAIPHLLKVVRLDPPQRDPLVELAQALCEVGRHQDGLRVMSRAVELYGKTTATMRVFASLLQQANSFSRAVCAANQALVQDPADTDALLVRASALAGLARHDEALAGFRRLAALTPDNLISASVLAMRSLYVPGIEPAEVFALHRRFGSLAGQRCAWRAPTTRPTRTSGRLALGFLSPDLRFHSVARFLLPLLEHFDRDRFEVFLYSTTQREDAMTQRLRTAVSGWRDVRTDTDRALPEAAQADNLDVLIDLGGLTQHSRVDLMASRLAPVQMTYCGYPCTTGIDAVDARLVDGDTDPPHFAHAWAGAERLARLNRCFLCYQPDEATPPVAPRPGGPIRFGCCNYPGKYSLPVLRAWARILQNVPGSRLVLKGWGFGDDASRSDYESLFRSAGLDLSRVDLLPHAGAHAEHMRLYTTMHIALDTWPYAGTTTTCEALWMGTPVITLAGSMHHERVGASLLGAVGLPELVAGDLDAYVRVASEMAQDPSRLAGLHATLRERMVASPLRDAAGLALAFEAAVLEAIERSRALAAA